MKILFAALAGFLVALAPLNAQTVSTASPAKPAAVAPASVEREEVVGTITDVTPERSLILHTGTSGGEPLEFRFAQQVTYVDEDGRVVEAAGLRKNLRVRVAFVKSGADRVIEKVTILQ